MRPEGPIFLLSSDSTFLDVRRDVESAQEHLTLEHAQRGEPVRDFLYFDGLARPLEARTDGGRVQVTVASATTDPWQVRARACEAIRGRREWLAQHAGPVVLQGTEVPLQEAQRRFAPLSTVGIDTAFPTFAVRLLEAFDAPEEHPGSFLHNLFHF